MVRIEDTDRERSTPEYTDSIIQSLEWLRLTSDEPLFIQSHALERHTAYIEQLLASGNAYKCYCQPDELQARLGSSEHGVLYDQKCRSCSQPDGNKPYVVRFRLPADSTQITFDDLILGPITIGLDQLDDFIIARSDGSPIYNFVVVIDDITMGITQVLRGQEHIGNTPKQLLLYRALGAQAPQFGHVPLIMDKTGKKLSKREAAVSVIEYKQAGYLSVALVNYLARLGWSHGDQELFTRDELIAAFSLDHVGKSNAIFDVEKLNWVNSEHIKRTSARELCDYIVHDLDAAWLEKLPGWNREQIEQALELYKPRVNTLRELANEIVLLHAGVSTFDATLVLAWLGETIVEHLRQLVVQLQQVDQWQVHELEQIIKGYSKQHAVALGQLAQPVRIALVGKTTSPGIFHLLALVGKKESINRLEALIKTVHTTR